MTAMPRRAADQVLHDYFRAKDGNRPHLLRDVFDEAATLEVVVNAGAISFPPKCQGIGPIADVLVRKFGQTYDNVYSFYLDRPPTQAAIEGFRCDWLVAMTAKADGAPRVGCGRYQWSFSRASGLAESLVITIDAMQVLAPAAAEPVLLWAAALPYPWCPRRVAIETAPASAELQPVLEAIRSRATGAR